MSATAIIDYFGIAVFAISGALLAAQTRQTLENIRAILASGGSEPRHLVRLTWYVVDMDAYLANLRELGRIYRDVLGPHYPAMALVQVVRLVEKAALLEIEATAVVPDECNSTAADPL